MANRKPHAVKTSRLLTALGENCREPYYTFTFTDDIEAMKYDTVLQKFDAYFAPKKNITYLRYRFFSCNQWQGQKIDDFVTELKSRAVEMKMKAAFVQMEGLSTDMNDNFDAMEDR